MSRNIKKVFPGGNTSEGFFSYYRYLLEKGHKRIFVIKGGPGVGKSTLMKKIGDRMIELGYEVEFHYCSSDNQSLDGIAIVEAGIVMVDGTAPHTIDPRYPGGLDEIVNMGEFWNLAAMEGNVGNIMASTNEVSRLFARAYRFFKAARSVAENIIAMNQNCMDFSAVNMITRKLERELLNPVYRPEADNTIGAERHLFSCAYTPEGFVDFSDSILSGIKRVYCLNGDMGTGKTSIMKKIADRALEKGLDVEIYHTPLIPDKIGTVLIKELDTAITTSPLLQNKGHETIDLDQYRDNGVLTGFAADLQSDHALLDDLLARGIDHIRLAKKEHDVLEHYYVPNMNFAAAAEKYEEILSRILDICESKATAATGSRYH